MKTIIITAVTLTWVVALTWVAFSVLYSKRHRTFNRLVKEFYEENERLKASTTNSPEAFASARRMQELLAEQKKLLNG